MTLYKWRIPATGLAALLAMTFTFTACGKEAKDTSAKSIAQTEETLTPDDNPSAPLPSSASSEDEQFPDVVDVKAKQEQDGSWNVSVTISSPYETSDRYADAWKVTDSDGNELGIRELAHDHASEQPFTRDLSGVKIDDDVETITVQGRDNQSGWGGETFDLDLTR